MLMAHDHSQPHRQSFGYTNFSSDDDLLTQSFQPSHEQELYSLPSAPAMEMLRISSKPHHSSGTEDRAWRAASFPMVAGSSSAVAASSLMQPPDEGGVVAAAVAMCPWPPPNVDDSARFLVPSNAQPRSRSLSLSLNQAEASNSGYGHPLFHQRVLSNPRDHSNFLQKATGFHQQLLKGSKYLIPTRELLNEFCNLNTSSITGSSKQKATVAKHEEEGASSSSSSSSSALNQALFNLDAHELQARKAKLICMVEEVDRRYRKYRDQMRAMVLSFEEVVGEGAATVYSTLASKVMSRHFRCLRDAITGQIQAIRRQMGEKDAPAPGSTRGETPRLKLIDQCLRQHKAFQQAGLMENHPWRPQRGLPERSVTILRAWLFEHFLHPYPSDVDKHILARQTGLSRSQVSNWFINARVRLWKPMVEEMYLEETKEQELSNNQASQENNYISDQQMDSDQNQNPIYSSFQVLELEEQKPATDSDSLSCIINNSSGRRDRIGSSGKSTSQTHPHSNAGEQFGVIDLDFTSFNQWGAGHSSAGGVSLTLGLQQHNGRGMGLSFSPPPAATQAPSLLFSGEQMEECEQSQFAILDGETTQNLRYRSLMGAQFMHDFPG